MKKNIGILISLALISGLLVGRIFLLIVKYLFISPNPANYNSDFIPIPLAIQK
jgi:hypothetical protein